jgi:hydrogenase/urease accessory protein HupE
VIAFVFAATPAFAHMPIEGVGGFVGGLLHPLLVPAHALSILALGLLMGPQHNRLLVWCIFSVGLALGLIAIALAVEETPAATVLLAACALAGLLIASARRLPTMVTCVLAATVGAAIALDSPPQTISIEEGNAILAGTGLGGSIALAAIIAVTARPRLPLQKIGTRIVGSWIAAIAIMVLAVRYATGDLP